MFGGVQDCYVVRTDDNDAEAEEWVRIALRAAERTVFNPSILTDTGGFCQAY
jgi:hypothetical protein